MNFQRAFQLAQPFLRVGLRPLCALCHGACETSLALCDACLLELPRITHACPCCGLPLSHRTALCGDCLQNPKPFQSSHCAFIYASPINYLMRQFKQSAHWQLGHLLCEQWLKHFQQQACRHQDKHLLQRHHPVEPIVLVPIPSHIKRTASRGYCPSHFIAHHLATALALDCSPLLTQQRELTPQKYLNRQQRLHNLVNAFTINNKIKHPPAHTRIILVDDVMTTCATAMAASTALNQQGFTNIHIWALARTPLEP